MSNKFLITGAIFIFVLLSGVWLSRTGRPLNTLILTIHKLISLSAVVYLVIIVYRIHQVTPLNPIEIHSCPHDIVFRNHDRDWWSVKHRQNHAGIRPQDPSDYPLSGNPIQCSITVPVAGSETIKTR